jgi:archaellum biogenesis protein FlaJ (TadC family)
MNFGALALIMICAIGAVMCVYVIAAGLPSTAFVDSQGNTTSEQTNISRSVVGNGTAPIGGAVGGGIILIVAVLIVAAVVGGIILAMPKHNSYSRYR